MSKVQIIPGDLFFFLKKLQPSGDAYEPDNQNNIDDQELTYYHVGFFYNETTLIHVVRGKGVILQSFLEAISITKPLRIEICRVKCDEEKRKEAIKFAYSEIGTAYNDIMTPNFINSKNQKAYSCTQLICEAFGGDFFEQEPMNFKDKNGKFYEFFVKQYAALNMPIPQGQLGTYPAQFRKSKKIFLIKVLERENEKMIEKEIAKENSANTWRFILSKMPSAKL
jgi:hypothetical protein